MVTAVGGTDCQLLTLRPPPDEIWIWMVPRLDDLRKEGDRHGICQIFYTNEIPEVFKFTQKAGAVYGTFPILVQSTQPKFSLEVEFWHSL